MSDIRASRADSRRAAAMNRQSLIPGPDHPITITPTSQIVTVRTGDTVIARTEHALTLQEASYPPVQYIPLKDVDQALLRKTESTTHCPYKGDASYYTITLRDGDLVDAVWTYEQASPAVKEIRDHVAFYTDRVDVEFG